MFALFLLWRLLLLQTWLLFKTIFCDARVICLIVHTGFCYFCFNFSGLHGLFLWFQFFSFRVFFALFWVTRCNYKFGHTCSSMFSMEKTRINLFHFIRVFFFRFFHRFSHIKVSKINRIECYTHSSKWSSRFFLFLCSGGLWRK